MFSHDGAFPTLPTSPDVLLFLVSNNFKRSLGLRHSWHNFGGWVVCPRVYVWCLLEAAAMSGSVCDIHRFSVSGVICVVWPCVCYECVPSVRCAHVRCALCARCMWCISISLCPVWVVCARCACDVFSARYVCDISGSLCVRCELCVAWYCRACSV